MEANQQILKLPAKQWKKISLPTLSASFPSLFPPHYQKLGMLTIKFIKGECNKIYSQKMDNTPHRKSIQRYQIIPNQKLAIEINQIYSSSSNLLWQVLL